MTINVPYAHYKCNDDASSTVVTDDGTGSNNGVASVNTSGLSVAGKINDGFDFERESSHYINLNSFATDVGMDTGGTISFWVKPETLTTETFFCISGPSANTYFSIYTTSSRYVGIYCKVNNVAKWVLLTGAILTTGEWYHIVLVHNGIDAIIYINGTEVSSTYSVSVDKAVWFLGLSSPVVSRLGCFSTEAESNSLYTDGIIDDFRYYKNRAIGKEEISFLYNYGAGTEENFNSYQRTQTIFIDR